MPKRTLLPDAVEAYLLETLIHEDPIAADLRTETAALPEAGMQIGPDQAALMALLVRLINARNVIEIGTFTGYSALAMARALPADGRIVCCDLSDTWTGLARRYWERAGIAERIDLRLGPAQQTLDSLREAGEDGRFDLAFIDADKTGYDAYYERCLHLIRPGGLILIDNTLWSGNVADGNVNDDTTRTLRALNLKIRDDTRVESVLLSIGDGVTLVRVK